MNEINRVHFSSISSTHDYALAHGANFPDWTVITADYQTGGHGRKGRCWNSPANSGLLCSIIIRQPISSAQLSLLLHVMTVSVAAFVERYGITPGIVWPNDVVVNGKKIAGILVDASTQDGITDTVVLSAGININHDAADLSSLEKKATSLFLETGVTRRIDDELPAFVGCCQQYYRLFMELGSSPIMRLWRKWEILSGKKVELVCGAETIAGVVTGFDDDGAISLTAEGRAIGPFHSGEITLLTTKDG